MPYYSLQGEECSLYCALIKKVAYPLDALNRYEIVLNCVIVFIYLTLR